MTMYLVYRSIGNPAKNTNIALVEGKVKARRLATALNNGVWQGVSQASPFFITKAPKVVSNITKETVRRIKRKIGER